MTKIEKLRGLWPWPNINPNLPKRWSGWCAPDTHKMLMMCPRNAKLVVECGSWAGLSAQVLLERAPQSTLVCIDHWCEKPEQVAKLTNVLPEVHELMPVIYNLFISNHWGNRNRIIPVRLDTLDGLQLLHDLELEPDFIYLDSDHTTERLLAELRLCNEFWPTTMLGGDDHNQLTVQEAVRLWCAETERVVASNATAFWTTLPAHGWRSDTVSPHHHSAG